MVAERWSGRPVLERERGEVFGRWMEMRRRKEWMVEEWKWSGMSEEGYGRTSERRRRVLVVGNWSGKGVEWCTYSGKRGEEG